MQLRTRVPRRDPDSDSKPPEDARAASQETSSKPRNNGQSSKRTATRRDSSGKAPPKKAARKSKWTAERLLSDPKSPLAKANLRNILCNPATWTLLDKADQEEILALFPDGAHISSQFEDQSRRPNFDSLKNDDSFRHACAVYTENLSLGRHDPEWLACAWAAHERRKMGDFDELLRQKFEDEWGIEMPNDDVSGIAKEIPEIKLDAKQEIGSQSSEPVTCNSEQKAELP